MKKHKPPTTPYTIRVSTELLKKSTPELRVKNKKEIDNLFKIKQSKNINNIDIAKYFNYAHSTISIFFNKYVGSQNIFKNISDFINESDFKQIEISQQYYGKIQIDNRENDVVIVAMVQKNETNLIQIERKNLTKLIKILRKETKK